jgi:hypothetical protein
MFHNESAQQHRSSMIGNVGEAFAVSFAEHDDRAPTVVHAINADCNKLTNSKAGHREDTNHQSIASPEEVLSAAEPSAGARCGAMISRSY